MGPDNAPPLELWPLEPTHTKVYGVETQYFPDFYRYERDGVKRTYPVVAGTGESEVLHWKTFNPMSRHRGMSPFAAAAFDVDIHNAGSEWNKALIDNDTRPSGLLTSEATNITGPQRKEIAQSIKEVEDGDRSYLILGNGLKWQQLGLSPKDLDWMGSKGVTANSIASSLGVPGQIIGLPGSQTYANYETALLVFYENTVIPLAKAYIAELNAWLVPKYGEQKLKIEINTDDIEALEPRRRERWESTAKADWITPDEKRIRTGFDPIGDPAYNEVYMPAGMLPIGLDIVESSGEKAIVQDLMRKGWTEEKAREHAGAIIAAYQSKE